MCGGGSLKDPSPCSSLSLWFFFHSCSCPQVILAQNKTKGSLSLTGNGKNGEVQAGCTSPFAYLAAGATRASPLLKPLEWNPYTSPSVSVKLQAAAVCTHGTPLGTWGGQGSRAAGQCSWRAGVGLRQGLGEGWLPACDASPTSAAERPVLGERTLLLKIF